MAISGKDKATRMVTAKKSLRGRVYQQHHKSGGYMDDAQFSNAIRNYAKAHNTTVADLEHFFETGRRR